MFKKAIQGLIIIIIGLFFIMSVFAQNMEELYSPTFLTGGTNAVSSESPMADIYNPAVSGADQRVSVDLSYLQLVGFGTETGTGLAVNLGLTIPQAYGVYAMSGHFITSDFTNRNLGTLGEFNFSFSKDLYSNLLIGAGIDLIAGTQSGAWDFGLGLDLGFVYLAGNLWILKDFAWGAALRDLGKGYNPTAGYWLYPRPFTLAAGAHFKVLKQKAINITLMPDIALMPDFSASPYVNFQFNLGAEVGLWDLVFLRGAFNLDVQDMMKTTPARPMFTFGLAMKFKTDISSNIKFLDISKRGWNRSEIRTNIAALPLTNDVWGFGGGANLTLGVVDKTPPEIVLETEETIYISPNLDGTNDDLILPIGIKDKRYVKGYQLIITDEEDKPVRTIVNKDERPENVTVENVWDRMIYVKKGITIPENIRWDGKSDTGTVVEDGRFSYSLEAWDDNGNISRSPARFVVIDTTAPDAKVESPDLIFSPNDDGNKDILEIQQTGSKEDKWDATIKNNDGDVVRNISWKDSALESYQWDGKNDEGILVSDGVYSYQIASTDRAGNSQTFKLENIIINTAATPINITIDLADFSPNGDGMKDEVRFTMDIPVTTGIESWTMDVVNTGGTAVRKYSGTNEIPFYIDFDGKDDSGRILPEGAFKGQLKLLYNNGNNPDAASPEFSIDLTPPSAFIKANLAIFSPNNDGNKDSVVITQDSSEELLWAGSILSTGNDVIKSYSWKGTVDSRIEWDGTDDNGKLMADDLYTYSIQCTDKAGNHGTSQVVRFQLNTEETPVLLSINNKFFSPNRDGEKDDITITPIIKIKTGVESYRMEVKDNNNIIVKSYSGKANIPEEFKWDGTDVNKKSVADGEYFAEFNVKYKNGNEPSAKTIPFLIDTVYPELELSSDTLLFSPDDDGKLDVVNIIQTSSDEELWDAEILDSGKNVIKSIYWKGKVDNFAWNGRDENGNVLENGFYNYRVFSTDRAGNKTERIIDNIEMDSRPATAFITVSSAGFSPNGDDYLDTVTFNNYVSLTEGIKSWKLEVVNREGTLLRTFDGEDVVDTKIIWDGTNDFGVVVEGTYTAVLTVEYFKGNTPTEKTNEFVLDISAPALSFEVTPELFSPDNDGYNDELSIKPSITDVSNIQQWEMEILDPKNNHFTSFIGKGVPTDEIIWDGVSDKGELVQAAEDYIVKFEAIDELGNTSQIEGTIPVDILVLRVGDRLYVRIASITFAPNTADYLSVEQEKLDRNMKTIKRLAQIFKKYGTYDILIEGHATSLMWAKAVEAAKEQKEELIPLSKNRADSIKNALVKEGLDPARITTDGIGGSKPVVPHSDVDNRWKNRRVEFILIRK